ncbi:MAG: helix-turn-helix domain-containing protein [Rugosibacter sp.]|nr:helix-turn-helix domain-containing protein [Rugosibacter sp.]
MKTNNGALHVASLEPEYGGNENPSGASGISDSGVDCVPYSLHELCFPLSLTDEEMRNIGVLAGKRRKLVRGQSLFRAGYPFESLYVVKTGFFKTEVLTEDGRTQVTSFPMAGEILGIDGISTEAHSCDVIALEDSEVCLLPFHEMETLSAQMSALQRHLYKILSHEIVCNQRLIVMLGTMRAEERVVAFLLNLSERFAARGYSPVEFHLRMSREEISSYLGLTIETVSRTFSHLREAKLIDVDKKHIYLFDIPGLEILLAKPAAAKNIFQ